MAARIVPASALSSHIIPAGTSDVEVDSLHVLTALLMGGGLEIGDPEEGGWEFRHLHGFWGGAGGGGWRRIGRERYLLVLGGI